MDATWVLRRPNSPATQMVVQANIKDNITALYFWSFVMQNRRE